MTPPPAASGEKPTFLSQFTQFSGLYWIANWMELVERFAYYGVRVVLPVFMVASFKDGGPEFDHLQKGFVYAIWALVQSFVPIFTGGFADRYGYKLNIAISTVLKIVGYLLMGFCIPLAERLAGAELSVARAAGTDLTFEIFFAGAMFLALGTAIFKPGLQGLIAHQMPRKSAALGWALFYQMVNIGGFIGPMIAGYLRVLEWQYVFLACSAGIALNFIPLLLFKEPEHHGDDNQAGPLKLLADAIHGLLEPRLFFFTISFAGFWLMFYQLFDILPNFIDDWVDSRAAASALAGVFGDGAVPTVNEGNLTQEWMINFNALLISCLAFAMGFLTGKVRSLTAIVVGIAVSAAAIYGLGMSMSGWWTLAAIGLFSLGEMSASPTKMRYLASIAPPGKEGLYMGYVNFTVGIGWSVGSVIAGEMYQEGGDKIVLARRYLVEEQGVAQEVVDGLGRADVLPFFQETLAMDPWQTRELLWNTYEPQSMWLVFTLIGLASMFLILVYDKVTSAANERPDHPFNTSGHLWVRTALVPIVGAFGLAWFRRPDDYSVAVLMIMFLIMFIASFTKKHEPSTAMKA
jgi:POT family proton-dependent oligopeptide transporter